MNGEYLQMDWQNGFEATLDGRVILTDTYIPMTPVPEPDFGRLVLEDTSKENFEVIRYNRKDTGGVYVEASEGGIRNEDGTSTGTHPRGARVRGNLTAQDIRELRKAAKDVQDGYMAMAAGSDWKDIPITPTVVSSNGQREHVLRYLGADYRATLQPGLKFRVPRTGTVPTTSMSFTAASSQMASRPTASVAGLTFTDDFTCEAWIKLNSYGGIRTIVSRSTAGNGFALRVHNDGRLSIYGGNGGSFDDVISYQAVPLGRWTHVAAALDTSGSVCTMYIDGVSVANTFTANTISSITQGGDLRIGGTHNAGEYFDGQIANVRVWSTIRTAAQIRDNMNQENPTSTTGLVAHFKGNGSWNDSSVNANHLTVVSGAVNNFASHPYSSIEYAVATKVDYTGGNTDVTVFTGPSCLPAETLGATSYSASRAPFGFPADRGKWSLRATNKAVFIQNAAAIDTWYTMRLALGVPTGDWNLKYRAVVAGTSSTNGDLRLQSGLGTSEASAPNMNIDGYGGASMLTVFLSEHSPSSSVTMQALTPVYLNARVRSRSLDTIQLLNDSANGYIEAECAYL